GSGEGRGQVAFVAGDPVAHQLDPAVAAPRLLSGRCSQVFRLDLLGVVTDVAAGAGDVAPRPDEARQILTLVHEASVSRRAAVTDQQRASIPVGERLAHRLPVTHGTGFVQTEVAVRVDQTGDDPPSGLCLRSRLRFEGDATVDDV